MSAAHAVSTTFRPFDQLRLARQILRTEGAALLALAERLPLAEFTQAVELIRQCAGRLIVSGMGKAGLIGRKLTATFASTGTPSQFLHPAEAMHGDLGCIQAEDVVLILSYSGETAEITRLLPSIRSAKVPLIAMTGKPQSTLARSASITLELGPLEEACALGLAPSTSTTAMLGLGDALALVVSQTRGFGPQDFVRFHPGGSLGRKLTKVEEVMRSLEDCRLCHDALTVRQAIVGQSRPGRRTGAIMLTDAEGRLTGIFTDSDLARLIAQTQDDALDQPVTRVMTRGPKQVRVGESLEVALRILEDHKISELPVTDAEGRPVGLIDVTDLIGVTGGPADGAAGPAVRLYRSPPA